MPVTTTQGPISSSVVAIVSVEPKCILICTGTPAEPDFTELLALVAALLVLRTIVYGLFIFRKGRAENGLKQSLDL